MAQYLTRRRLFIGIGVALAGSIGGLAGTFLSTGSELDGSVRDIPAMSIVLANKRADSTEASVEILDGTGDVVWSVDQSLAAGDEVNYDEVVPVGAYTYIIQGHDEEMARSPVNEAEVCEGGYVRIEDEDNNQIALYLNGNCE